MTLYDFYHKQIRVVKDCQYVIGEIAYYSQYGNWPVSVAVFLQHLRIRWAKLIITILDLFPYEYFEYKPLVDDDKFRLFDDEIPF